MQAVLDGPMASHDPGQAFGWQAQRRDEEPRLPFDCAADLADAVDDDDAVQAGPVVALLQPGDIVQDGGIAGLDAAVRQWSRRRLRSPSGRAASEQRRSRWISRPP